MNKQPTTINMESFVAGPVVPRALVLANDLELDIGYESMCEAAIELRRLHQLATEGWRYADELEQDRKKLAEVNTELLAAITKTVEENLHLADGDNCTLIDLVRVLDKNGIIV